MMRTAGATRQVLAMMVVATALCADRVTASPMPRPQAVRAEPMHVPQVVQIARRLADRFRQIVPNALLPQETPFSRSDLIASPSTCDQSLSVARIAFSPFQFRLPPPLA